MTAAVVWLATGPFSGNGSLSYPKCHVNGMIRTRSGRMAHCGLVHQRAIRSFPKVFVMTRTFALAAAVLALASVQASANETQASIDARLQRQLGQIEQGRQDGSITWTEGIKLRAEAKSIAERESDLLEAHGKLTKKDRVELKKDEHKFAEDIEDKKENGLRRPFWLPRVGR
jgi:hypothetical protein